MKDTVLKYAATALILLAGSCSAPGPGNDFDPVANHSIQVRPHYAMAQFIAPDPAADMPPDEAGRLGSFVADYLEHGHGALAISVPAGMQENAITRYFGSKLSALGIPESHMRVGTHDRSEGTKVWLQYLTYTAGTDACGDWSDNTSFTMLNQTTRNFGCATQHNIAAQVDNPEDLIRPRKSEGASGARRATVIDKYEKGEDTASKSKNASVKISDVGDSGSSGN